MNLSDVIKAIEARGFKRDHGIGTELCWKKDDSGTATALDPYDERIPVVNSLMTVVLTTGGGMAIFETRLRRDPTGSA